MSEEIKNCRMQQKRDTSSNWNSDLGKDFIPKPGELIVVNDNLEEQIRGSNTRSVFKVGDGITPVKELQGMTGEVYVQAEKPEMAGEGAIWIDPSELSESPGSTVITWNNIVGRPPIEVSEDGYTEIQGVRKPTSIEFVDDSCIVTVESGLTNTYKFEYDELGNIIAIVIDGTHVISIGGVS